ncbi:arginine--tRNA ligase [Magnetospira sp. QH-2]|uniref:arginine--tRNA ligase n=1 Tax=Magnetospira sp. (strain QH-2) TaxID=1288970 RepID=UPI0003E80C66|nr:arginine--tRNA ligase [Magnetospira sp. QH-2]CCQ73623.1 Arginyl-tRNA synthetase [Magnetospira sp. QH-2]
MNLFKTFTDKLNTVLDQLAAEGELPEGLDVSRISVEPPRDPSHGDISTNAALVLSKQAKMKPRDLAEKIAAKLDALEEVTGTDVAGPGFINLRIADGFWLDLLKAVLVAGPSYGESGMGGGRKVNVEYVSANPTGPMHVGHGRGAVVGDVLASLLAKAGFDVTREYYINDAGAQVDALARSLHFRYLIALGRKTPADFDAARAAGTVEYGGDYLVPAAEALAARDGDKWADLDEALWLPELRLYGVDKMMDLIRADLGALGVEFAAFTSERELVQAGAVDAAAQYLEEKGLAYTGVLEPPKGKKPDDWEPVPLYLFKASEFGDDVDRPLKKSDGGWTYFATDMAYHKDKVARGFADMIDVWGADHGGYVKRMQAAVKALTGGEGELDVKLCQMVNLLSDGKPVKMSKRAGTFVTLREVIDQVGKDVVRFIMLTRKNDAHLDFDLVKVTEQSKDNPVFYVQYAHARCHSVFRSATEMFDGLDLSAGALAEADLSPLRSEDELALIKTLAAWPRQVEAAAEAHEPHRVAYYLYELAAQFHTLWTKGNRDASLRFIAEEDRDLTRARLALLMGVATVVASGLGVFGVTPLEEMR